MTDAAAVGEAGVTAASNRMTVASEAAGTAVGNRAPVAGEAGVTC